jgi:hypothetical protein
MLGCWRSAVVLISARNRSAPTTAASSGLSTFTATCARGAGRRRGTRWPCRPRRARARCGSGPPALIQARNRCRRIGLDDAHDRDGRQRRNPAVHEPGAGHGRPACGSCRRHPRARLRAVRDVGRRAAVQGIDAPGDPRQDRSRQADAAAHRSASTRTERSAGSPWKAVFRPVSRRSRACPSGRAGVRTARYSMLPERVPGACGG